MVGHDDGLTKVLFHKERQEKPVGRDKIQTKTSHINKAVVLAWRSVLKCYYTTAN
jgi:hypothetical protein